MLGPPSGAAVTVNTALLPTQASTSAGCTDITGICASVTVTVNWQVDVLPAASVALHLTVVVPSGKADPLAGPDTKAVVTPGQLSVAVTV